MNFSNYLFDFRIAFKNKKFLVDIPDSYALQAIDKLKEINNWFYKEFIKDCDVNHDKDFFKYYSNFGMHNTGRLLAYINNVYSIERILKKLYKNTIFQLKKIDSSCCEEVSEINSREQEIEQEMIFRNKISAHPSYGDPRDFKTKNEDNFATQMKSLVTLTSWSLGDGSIENFCLGSNNLLIMDEKNKYTSSEIPPINFKKFHSKLEQHYSNWMGMFKQKIEPILLKLPMDNGDHCFFKI